MTSGYRESSSALVMNGPLRLKACLVAEDAERQLRAAVENHLKATVPDIRADRPDTQ